MYPVRAWLRLWPGRKPLVVDWLADIASQVLTYGSVVDACCKRTSYPRLPYTSL